MTSSKNDAMDAGPLAQAQTKNAKGRIFYLFIALVVLVIFSAIAVYISTQLQYKVTKETQALMTQVDNLKKQQEDSVKEIDTMMQLMDKADEKLNIAVQNFNQTIKNRNYNKQDWLLLKAKYMLELAQINAHWSRDNNATSSLLVHADYLLKEVSDTEIYQVRQAIHKEIQAVDAIPQVDITGILSQIDAVQNMVDRLSTHKLQALQKQVPESFDGDGSWRDSFKGSMQYLSNLIVIRHYEDGAPQVFTSTQEALVRESLRLKLQEAQMVVIQQNQILYKLILQQAQNLVKRSFDSAEGEVVVSRLEKLQDLTLSPQKPELGGALTRLTSYINTKNITN